VTFAPEDLGVILSGTPPIDVRHAVARPDRIPYCTKYLAIKAREIGLINKGQFVANSSNFGKKKFNPVLQI
jgi:hypothetical protein